MPKKELYSGILHIFTPTKKNSEENIPIADHDGTILYYARPSKENYFTHLEFDPNVYPHFTFVLNKDGTLWKEANFYLLSMIENDAGAISPESRISPETIKAHAKALQAYKHFCDMKDEEKKEDRRTQHKGKEPETTTQKAFWEVAKNPILRPNIIFKRHLENRMKKDELEASTIKKTLGPISAFYVFVQNELGMTFDTPMPGRKSQAVINYGNGNGRLVDYFDANQVASAPNDDDGYIRDGGKLKPLTESEQDALKEALHNLANPEILLAFLFSIATGARMITALTVRLTHFISSFPEDYSADGLKQWASEQEPIDPHKEYDRAVGDGTLIDTKGTAVRYNLKIPGWLILAYRTYIISERARSRRQKIKNPQENPLEEYVFITQKAKQPFYVAKSDPNKGKYKSLPKGGALETFIAESLRPKLKEMGYFFEFKFHDMRATFGMNYVLDHEHLLANELWTRAKLIDYLKKRMGHKNASTTELYLNYQRLKESKAEALDKRYEKLKGWLNDDKICNRSNFSA